MGHIVNIKDLEDENVYIDLNKKSKEILKQKIKNKFKTYKTFSKQLNLKVDNLKRNNDLLHFFGGHKITLKFLQKIISPFPELTESFIEKNIYRIGCKRGNKDIYNPKLPFDFNNKEGIRFISAILFDGGISSILKPIYRNNDKHLRNIIINCSKKIFGDFEEKEIGTLILFPKITGIILKRIGLKEGKKVITNPKIPKFIFNTKITNKGLFLRQAFDDDGCVPQPHIKYITIGIHIDVTEGDRKSNLIEGIKKLLEDFNIYINESFIAREYKIGNNLRQRWSINIYARKNLEIFYDKIGFDIKKKRNRLFKMINSYKTSKYQLQKNQRYEISLKKLQEGLKEKYFTIKQTSNIIDLDYHYTKQLIWRMERENILGRKKSLSDKNIKFFFK